MKKTKRYGFVFLLCMVMLVLGACSGEEQTKETTTEATTEAMPTAKELLEAAYQALNGLDAFKGNVKMDMKMTLSQEGVSETMDMGMDLDVSATKDPDAYYMDGSVRTMGVTVDMEVYSVEEEGKRVTYSKMFDLWSKSVELGSAGSGMDLADMSSLDEVLADEVELTLAEQTEMLDGKEVYVITLDVGSEYWEKVMSMYSGMMGDMGDLAIDYSNMTVAIKYLVYKESRNLAQVSMEMQWKEAQEEGDVAISFDEMNTVVTYYEEAVAPIVVPEEAKEAAANNDDQVISGEVGGTEEDPSLDAIGLVQDEHGNYVLKGWYPEDDITVLVAVPAGYETDTYYSNGQELYFDHAQSNDREEMYAYYTAYILEGDFDESVFSKDHQNDVKLMQGDSSFKNIETTEVQSIMVGEYEVKYTRLSYTYGGTIQCLEYNTWAITGGNKILSCDTYCTAYEGACTLVPDEAALMYALYSGVKIQ